MKYLYIVTATIVIIIITVFTFKADFIYYNYAKYAIENNDNNKILKNKYYYEEDFSYIKEYDGLEIHNKEELYGTIYYIINSGVITAERYFSIDYIDYEKDYNEIFDKDSKDSKLNSINNFVHPYNVFNSIYVDLEGYKLTITIDYKDFYPEEKRNLIDNKVNDIIEKLITTDMNNKEKIKVIHDYIINNTIYDEDFCIEEDPKNCETTSPYQADTAYGVLFEHYGICSGYTDLMAIFLDKLEIANYRIINDSHTWNAVKIDNIWYHLDTTWDDPISDKEILTYTYFLITTTEDSLLEKVHVFDKEIFIELS